MEHLTFNSHFIIYIIIFHTMIYSGSSQHFGYNEKDGPNHWGENYDKCVGKHQSPIDIWEDKVKIIKLGDVTFDNFQEIPEEATIQNNGHTVTVSLKSEKQPEVSNGPLNGTYTFSQFHFHWGEHDEEGSENMINNNSFPMEMHMVFYKKEYGNITEAMMHSDGLTVLAFLFKISDQDNKNYNHIVKQLNKIQNPQMSTSINSKTFNLDSLLIKNRKQYFTYDGSLTTPPCYEVVTWIEFKQSIPLSHSQLDKFRSLNNGEGKMTRNFRPTQPLNDRLIYFNHGDYKSNSNIIKTNLMIVLSAIIFLVKLRVCEIA